MKLIDKVFKDEEFRNYVIDTFCPKSFDNFTEYECQNSKISEEDCEKCWNQEYKEGVKDENN